jgi:hypothetical protein
MLVREKCGAGTEIAVGIEFRPCFGVALAGLTTCAGTPPIEVENRTGINVVNNGSMSEQRTPVAQRECFSAADQPRKKPAIIQVRVSTIVTFAA